MNNIFEEDGKNIEKDRKKINKKIEKDQNKIKKDHENGKRFQKLKKDLKSPEIAIF